MKKKMIVFGMMLALVLSVSSVYAGPWGGRFYGMGPALGSMTPEQQTKILALQQAHQEKVAPIQEQLWKKKMELRTLWLNPNPDKTKINELQQEVFGLIDQMQQESTGLRAEMLKVLQSN